jgi:Flp pilus assembly protein TadD/4-amino-4-deoxy-L-arabinose transferase-like glycosyltransferase
VALLLAAAAVRLVAFLAHRASPFAAAPMLDAELYDSWAREIAGGAWIGHQVFYANPLYPYVLAVLYKLTGGSAELARLVQHAMGVVTVLLTYRLTLGAAGRLAAAIAAGLAAFYLPFIAFEQTLLIATLGVLLTAAGLLAAVRAAERRTPGAWLATGAVAGLALLARPTLIPLAVLVWIRTLGGGWRRAARALLACLAGIVLVIAPVTVRNAAVSGRLVPITAHGGETFYVGNRPGADGSNLQPDFVRSGPRFEHEDFRREAARRLGRPVDLETASRYWMRQAFHFIVTQPAAYARLELRKLALIAHAYEKGDNLDLDTRRQWIALFGLPWPGFGLVGALGFLGLGWWLVAGRRGGRPADAPEDDGSADDPPGRRRSILRLLALATAAQIASLLLYFVTARYRLPLVVTLLPFAGLAAARLVWLARGAPRRRLLAPLAGLVVIAAILNRPLPAAQRNDPALAAINLGVLLEGRGDLARAEEAYRRAIQLRPDEPLAHFNLGVVLRRQERFAAARRAFEAALALDANHTDALEQLGMTLEQSGDLDGARRLYRRAIELEPGRALLFRDLGRVAYRSGDLEAAEAAWRRALALEPGDRVTAERLEIVRRQRREAGEGPPGAGPPGAAPPGAEPPGQP